MELPNKKYNIIYADPPWAYNDKASAGKRGASYKYDVMNVEDIIGIGVKNIAEEDSALFMWVTMPMLNICFSVIEAWGFQYKTCAFVWVKTNKTNNVYQTSFLPSDSFNDFLGMGSWTRANAELCLLATRGKIKRANANVRQIIYSPLENHSKKPDEARNRIVRLIGDLPRIEMFARQKTAGWDAWGNEAPMAQT